MSRRGTTRDDRLDVELDALARGVHADPFSLLGPHRVHGEGRSGVVVRVCLPGARAVEVVRDGGVTGMARRHPDGLFEAFFDGERDLFDYRLRVTGPDGWERQIDDPYRFGAVLSDFDLHLLGEGRNLRAFEKLGAHPLSLGPVAGMFFAVWAPNAHRVSVVGDFNGWDGRVHPMRARVPSGIWELFLPDVGPGERYKYEIRTRHGDLILKADPFGVQFEPPPGAAAITPGPHRYEWADADWMHRRASEGGALDRPMSIYEAHLGSWRRVPEEGNRYLTYRELAAQLVPYVRDLGFTHVELLPVMEHPFDGSWGYQVTGFFAPTSRFGTPDDFRYFVDACHAHGIGVILDWVPGHFPKDSHALARFDGTALYEHEDPRQGEHTEWGTLVFNYGRHEVRNFLLASALYWLEEFHIDGLRVDAVASMLYLDYSRREGEWVPNRFGGRENLDAIEFLRELNSLTHGRCPGSITAAEESTAWPGVSRPVHLGGLGFTYKWNMGWMHDILEYVKLDSVYRKWSHQSITFSMLYAFHENFLLPFSHDEVVHGKRALIDKIPGDAWQKAATLRALFGYMYGHPGKKLLFMGAEFGQWREWNHDDSLDWHLLGDPRHEGIRLWLRDLNAVYRAEPSLHEIDFDPSGFRWIDCHDADASIVSFVRMARNQGDFAVIILNFTPVPRTDYRVGVPGGGTYRELLNSDGGMYGGSNLGNAGWVSAEDVEAHGFPCSLNLVIPPLACLILKPTS